MVERMVQGVATWHEKGVWSMAQPRNCQELGMVLMRKGTEVRLER